LATDWKKLRDERVAKFPPEKRAMYEKRAAGPKLYDNPVDVIRKATANMPGSRDLAAGVTYKDVQIPGPAGPVPTRIYTPEGEGPMGVFLHLHAGGFIMLNGLDTLLGANSKMARELGMIVVAPDFRIAPEHKFPATIDDCWAVTQWVGENCASFGGDPERLMVGGGCTGGNYSAVMAIMARDAGKPKIALQYLSATLLDCRMDYRSTYECGEGYMLNRDENAYVIGQYLADPEQRWDWRASPVLATSLKGVAPAIISDGEYDILRDENIFYAGRLRDAGVDVHLRIVPEESHVFFPAASEANRKEVWALIRSKVGPEAVKRPSRRRKQG